MNIIRLVFITLFLISCTLFSTTPFTDKSIETISLQPQPAQEIAQDMVFFAKDLIAPGQQSLLLNSTHGIFGAQFEQYFRLAGYAVYVDKKTAPDNAALVIYLVDNLSSNEIRAGMRIDSYQFERLYRLENNHAVPITGFTLLNIKE